MTKTQVPFSLGWVRSADLTRSQYDDNVAANITQPMNL
jgi:hypothetical protein